MIAGQKARYAQGQNTQSVGVSAPVDGIIATGLFQGQSGGVADRGAGGPSAAIWLYNMVAAEYGCRVRQGSREFAINIPTSEGVGKGEVRCVMYYNSVIAGGSVDKIFACTDLGIYDVTNGGAGPHVQALEWPSQEGDAGWSVALNYTNVAGAHYLLVCDEANGYWIYDGAVWQAGTFTGGPSAPDPADLVHITEWNGRIWFVEKNTARAWFLDPLALEGDITALDVGSRFKDGGHLVQCSTWSLDDGAGMDDKFVMISSAGDVLVWAGLDPTTASDLTLVGRWSVGSVPEGRRVLSDWGGDVAILSTQGVITLTALLSGTSTLSSEKFLTQNISQYVRGVMEDTLDFYGWSMEQVPRQGIVIFSVPNGSKFSGGLPIQFVLDTSTSSWSMFRGLDMLSMSRYGSEFLFGTSDNRLMLHTGTLDNVPLGGQTGEAVSFSILTHYSGLGQASIWKRPQYIRPYWVGSQQPTFNIQIRFDFDIEELRKSPAYLPKDLSQWDSAIWDNALWEGTAQSYLETIGLNGMGRHMAIAVRGNSVADLTLVGFDIMYDTGGMM
jgi:hypothetical protein